ENGEHEREGRTLLHPSGALAIADAPKLSTSASGAERLARLALELLPGQLRDRRLHVLAPRDGAQLVVAHVADELGSDDEGRPRVANEVELDLVIARPLPVVANHAQDGLGDETARRRGHDLGFLDEGA